MRRLILTAATTFLAFLLLAPPAWADWVWPLRGEVITPYRNGDDPYASGQHRGIDIAGDVGAPVVAAAGGEVWFAGTAGSSGLTVSVRTADGRYDTSYLHLSSTAVREGDRIAAGERLGTVGTSGVRSASTPHLHFGIRDAGSRHAYHDPLDLLPPAPPASPAPRGAPAPQPAPAPAAPTPAPAPVHAPAGRRVPATAPRRTPAPAPRRVPATAPRRLPAPAPRRVPGTAPGRVRGTAPHRIPATAPRHVSGLAPRPGRAPGAEAVSAPDAPRVPAPSLRDAPQPDPDAVARAAPGRRAIAGQAPDRPGIPGPHVAMADGGARQPGEAGSPGTKAESGSGPDLGLVLACLGVLVAAALLGLTGDGQTASQRTGHRLARVLQPLFGRR